jgi:hypothetical protein
MKDTVTESWLTRGSITFDYMPSVPFQEIASDKVSERNIRLGAEILEEQVMKMAIDLENGAELPAIVLYRYQKGPHAGK